MASSKSFRFFLFIPPLLASALLVGLFVYFSSSPKKVPSQPLSSFEVEQQLAEVKHLYQQGKLEEAKKKASSKQSSFILMDEGCSLLISLYAKLEDYELLREYSKRCFKHPTNRDIAYEGYAKSSLELGLGREAIGALEEEIKKHSSERLLAATGQLYFFEKNYPRAREYFAKLVHDSSMWPAWLYRALKLKALFKDPQFVERLVVELENKKQISRTVEGQLLSYAKLYKLSSSVKSLEKRLKRLGLEKS